MALVKIRNFQTAAGGRNLFLYGSEDDDYEVTLQETRFGPAANFSWETFWNPDGTVNFKLQDQNKFLACQGDAGSELKINNRMSADTAWEVLIGDGHFRFRRSGNLYAVPHGNSVEAGNYVIGYPGGEYLDWVFEEVPQ